MKSRWKKGTVGCRIVFNNEGKYIIVGYERCVFIIYLMLDTARWLNDWLFCLIVDNSVCGLLIQILKLKL